MCGLGFKYVYLQPKVAKKKLNKSVQKKGGNIEKKKSKTYKNFH